MKVNELREKFLKRKNFEAESVNQLLDFAKKAYVLGDISIKEYRELTRELESLGAKVPDGEEEFSVSHN
ncbi:YppF family protein [Bacillus massilinigeriensis]|uniref:YppF family protein n=1 Tax=Bacillus massilionigeriensis TaxID=1805475 RepID=UPI00096B397B|nr:YppF family protein [Bacillus massilionigeriensis]